MIRLLSIYVALSAVVPQTNPETWTSPNEITHVAIDPHSSMPPDIGSVLDTLFRILPLVYVML